MSPSGRRFIIDATMIHGGGGFTHLLNILPEFARLAPGDRFRVLCSDRRVAERLPVAANIEVRFLGPMSLRERLRFTYREAARHAAEWGADLYFSESEMAPLDAPCATIAAFQNANVTDLGRAHKLRWKRRIRLHMLNAIARMSARRCDRVMFVSESSASEMGAALHVPVERRAAIPHGIDPARWRRPTRRALAPHERPYILSVGSIYAYKNYVRLIEAYADVARRHPDVPDLVIVGDEQDGDYSRRMKQARDATGELAEAIHLVGDVSYEEIHHYYHGASLFVLPSHLETFGIPLLEAMASGVPIVASDMPVFREVARDAAVYADPFDVPALANAISEVLYRPAAAAGLVKRGQERVREFTWQRSATRLLSLFHAAIRDREEVRKPRRRRSALITNDHAVLPSFAYRVPVLPMHGR